MKYTLKQLRDTLFKGVYDVYDVFKNHFGEEYTDLQGMPNDAELVAITGVEYSNEIELSDKQLKGIEEQLVYKTVNIYVWWPKVTVTNEYGKSVDIQDLYAKVTVNANGNMPYESVGFRLNRSTYTEDQFLSNYLHSHVSGIPKHDFRMFKAPCLGTGPLVQTVITLKTHNDTAEWMLFCEELSRYVTVESIDGVPYKRLEQIGNYRATTGYKGWEAPRNDVFMFYHRYANTFVSTPTPPLFQDKDVFYKYLRDFILYYLKNGHLSFSFCDGHFTCGLSYYNYIIDVSNSFISYFNSSDDPKLLNGRDFLFKCNFLNKVLISNGGFLTPGGDDTDDVECCQGQHVLTFKGQDIRLKIISRQDSDRHLSTLLDQKVAMFIMAEILRTLNFRFINDRKEREPWKEPSVSETCEAIYYL